MVIVYRLGPLSYSLGRLLVRGVRDIGVPHIVAGRGSVREFPLGQVDAPHLEQPGSPARPQPLRGPLPWAVVGVLLASFLRGGFDFGASYLTDWVGQRVMTDLRNQLTAHMQRLDLAFFNRRRAGQIVSRVTADVALVRGLVTDAVTSIFEDFARLIGLVAMAVYFDWVLALVAVCLFPVAALPLRYFSSPLRQASRRT